MVPSGNDPRSRRWGHKAPFGGTFSRRVSATLSAGHTRTPSFTRGRGSLSSSTTTGPGSDSP